MFTYYYYYYYYMQHVTDDALCISPPVHHATDCVQCNQPNCYPPSVSDLKLTCLPNPFF